jgi:predicted DNA-binding transcriptional regulator AlpA
MPDSLTSIAADEAQQPPMPDMQDPNRLLTIGEFCAWTKVSKRTWRAWCLEGLAPRRIKIAGSVRVRVADALAWAEARYVD